MSNWNYRVWKVTDEYGENLLAIFETFYTDNGEIYGRDSAPSYPSGENEESFGGDMMCFIEALSSTVLEDTTENPFSYSPYPFPVKK